MDTHSQSLPRRFVVALSAAALAALGLCASANDQEGQLLKEEWSAVFMGGARVGHSHNTLRRIEGEEPILRLAADMRMTVKRMGQSVSMGVVAIYEEEERTGRITGFGRELDASVMSMAFRGEVKDGKLRLRKPGAPEPEVTAWDDTLLGPMAIERRLSAKEFKPGMEAAFRTYSLDFFKPVELRFAIQGKETVEIWGERKELWKAEVTQDAMPGIATTVWMTDGGDSLKTRTQALGSEILVMRAPRSIALGEVEPAEVFLEAGVVRLERAIPRPREARRVDYRLRFDNSDALELNLEGPRQETLSREGSEVTLRVSVQPPPAEASVEAALVERRYLGPSSYIQSDDPAIRAAAEEAAGDAQHPWEVAKRLDAWVFDHIEDKDLAVGFASAAETLETRHGDCTEHSVLLAALLRARGIPARLAFGVAYFLDPETGEPGMGGHVWNEVWIDGWHSLDATLAKAFVDAARIKLGDAALDGPAVGSELLGLVSVLGSTQIEILEVSHTEPE